MIRPLLQFLTDPGPSMRTSPPVKWGVALFLAFGRWWLAWPFLTAGWHRVLTWDSQEFLFTEVHPVPFLPAVLAAPLTTGAEIALGLSLLLGLAGRAGAAGLAVMAATLFLVIGRTPQGMENGIAIAAEQIPWIMVGAVLFVSGPGLLSLDAALRRFRLFPFALAPR
ncbi:DoxX family membrane protein [Niveispirillum sp. KHB5.9]|uniref:DoxX family membrane protein n=1 Tax=Niveispirillum sp. KHB5.9 TaxID=3400269 RepID=UPI003A84EC94